MKCQRPLLFALLIAIPLVCSSPAYPACSGGLRLMALQNSDIRLDPGIPAYRAIQIMTVSLPIPKNAIPADCGLYARSNLNGLAIESGYGSGSQFYPAGGWAPIGRAISADTNTYPLYNPPPIGAVFAFRYDGQANASEGMIEIAVGGDDSGNPQMKIIGAIPVHVTSASYPSTWFTVLSNTTGKWIYVEHPLLNGKPNAGLHVTHVYNPPDKKPRYWNHPLMVAYDQSRWRIGNADGVGMEPGLAFNIFIDPSAKRHKWDGHVPVNAIQIDDPRANDNAYATIVITQVGSKNVHPVEVSYKGNRWYITNADGASIPAGTGFYVSVLGFTEYHKDLQSPYLDRYWSNAGGISMAENYGKAPSFQTYERLLDFWWQRGGKTHPIIITANRSPAEETNDAVPHYLGLKYVWDAERPRWAIIHEDQSIMRRREAFNVYGRPVSFIE